MSNKTRKIKTSAQQGKCTLMENTTVRDNETKESEKLTQYLHIR